MVECANMYKIKKKSRSPFFYGSKHQSPEFRNYSWKLSLILSVSKQITDEYEIELPRAKCGTLGIYFRTVLLK